MLLDFIKTALETEVVNNFNFNNNELVVYLSNGTKAKIKIKNMA